MQNIEAMFSKVYLNLQLEQRPFLLNNPAAIVWKAFQMTIRRNKSNGNENPNEYFQAYLGDNNNSIQVLELNRKRKQVLLQVKEPERRFIHRMHDLNGTYLYSFKDRIPASNRKYLCGKDESHLFIAEITSERVVKSIEGAYRALMPQPVQEAYRRQDRVLRQGEWFFVPVNPTERRLIELIARGIRHEGVEGRLHGRLNPNGNPHVVEKLLRYKAPSSRRWMGEEFVFAKGNVWHGEHKTIYLDDWHRAIRNTERVGPKFIGWTD